MNIGGYRHRVKIEQVTSTQNTYGERVETWTKYLDTWARIEPLQGREYWNAKQDVSEVNTKITMRYQAGVVPAMRVVNNTTDIYDIESVINVKNANRELQLMCKQVNA